MEAKLDGEMVEVFASPGPVERKAVLHYARTLQRPQGDARPSLLGFVGSISNEDLELIGQAIEEEFQRV